MSESQRFAGSFRFASADAIARARAQLDDAARRDEKIGEVLPDAFVWRHDSVDVSWEGSISAAFYESMELLLPAIARLAESGDVLCSFGSEEERVDERVSAPTGVMRRVPVRRKKEKTPEDDGKAGPNAALSREILGDGRPFVMAVSGDHDAIATRFLDAIPGTPHEMSVDYKTVKKIPRNFRARVATAKKEWSLRFGDNGWGINQARGVVTLWVPRRPTVESVLALLAELPFELASFASVHPWMENGETYLGTGFADGHCKHGWACAFRGAGHNRLVSRRWLDHGPWTLIRAPGDLSFVLFHDLAVDAQTALARAKPGHLRMGLSPEGGFLQTDYLFQHALEGVADATSGEYRIDARGRDVTQREMRDASAASKLGRLPARVTFVFDDEARAREHLPLLWLHEHGCLLVAHGSERRLDEGYSGP